VEILIVPMDFQVGDHQCSHCGERKSVPIEHAARRCFIIAEGTGTCGRPNTTGLLFIGNSARIGAQDARYSTIRLSDYGNFRSVSKFARSFLS
jgi:hypothetical protein